MTRNTNRNTVTNPLTGRLIQVGGNTFNQLTFDAYDYINRELVRRENAPPIPPRVYYYNIITRRRILHGSRKYCELMDADWEIEEQQNLCYLIPPWLSDGDAQELINHWRENNGQPEPDLPPIRPALPSRRPTTYEELMAMHGETLANLNIGVCRECFYPLKLEEGEYCHDCQR